MSDGHSSEVSESRARAAAKARSERFFYSGIITVAAVAIYYALTAKVDDVLNLYQGIAMILLAATPALQWARRGEAEFPVFEVFMLTTANTYALPLLSGHSYLKYFSPEVITDSAWVVILFQASAICVFSSLKGTPGRSRFWTDDVMSKDLQRNLGYGIALNTIYTFVSVFYPVIPNDLIGISRAIFFGIGNVCTFVQGKRWGEGNLPAHEKTFFVTNTAIQIVVLISGLFMVSGVSLLVLGLLGYISGGKKVPVIFCVVSFGIMAVLFNGKGAMRDKYWDTTTTDFKQVLSPGDLPGLYSEWFQLGLQRDQEDQKRSTKLVDRTSLFHILCLVVSMTPEPLPYLNGETYAQIPGQFVPRFFWAAKPVGHISTYTLAIYYGLQRAEDTTRTTIGFGIVTEAYANFGAIGVISVGAMIGFALKKIRWLTLNSPMLSYGGLMLVILMAWSFQTEFTMSIWLSSFFQACACVLGIPLIIKSFIG